MVRRQEIESDFQPRHRILGAIVLVTFGFILFSVLLSEQPQNLNADDKIIATTPGVRVVVTQVPTAAPNKANSKKPQRTTKVVDNPLASQHLLKTASRTPANTVNLPSIDRTTKQSTAVTRSNKTSKKNFSDKSKKWIVQVGTFSDPANARRLTQKLRSQGYQVETKKVALESGVAVKVRVGPYAGRQLAVNARNRINKINGIRGLVQARK